MNTEVKIKQKITTRDMILCSLFTALIWVGAFIKIPVLYVPVTLQIVFTNLAGLMLGGYLGSLSVLIYVLLGLSGVPVFTSGGGIGYIFRPTFGYLLGFILGTFVAGKISEKNKENSLKKYWFASVINLLIVYSTGVIYMYLLINFYTGTPITAKEVIVQGMLIPLPANLLTIILSTFVLKKVAPIIKKR